MKINHKLPLIAIFVLMMHGASNACIKVPIKYVYPSNSCDWAQDFLMDSSYIGIVKIDSIRQMHSDDYSNDQQFTYMVYYSKEKDLFNQIEMNGVFIYQSMSICYERTDIRLKIGSNYLVSLSLVNEIPYSEIYIDDAKIFLKSKNNYLLMNEYAHVSQANEIVSTIENFKMKCQKVINKEWDKWINRTPTILDSLD